MTLSAIRLTHANHRRPMYVTRELIGGVYYSPGHKCTHVVLTGGAIFPALEDEKEVYRLVYGADAPNEPAHKEGQNDE